MRFLGLQRVSLCCQGVPLRLKLGLSGGKLLVLSVDLPQGLLLANLRLPTLFRQCAFLGLQNVSLCCQGVPFRFKLGGSGGELLVPSVDLPLGLLLANLPLPTLFRQCVLLGRQTISLGSQTVPLRLKLGQLSVNLVALLVRAAIGCLLSLPLPLFFHQRAALQFEFGQLSLDLLALSVDALLNLFLPDLPLPAILVQCAAMALQLVPLCGQGISLRFELGRSGGELFALLDDLPLSQFLPGLPLPAILVQCAATAFQLAPLCGQGISLRFELGRSGGELLALLDDLPLSLFLPSLPLPAILVQCAVMAFQLAPLCGQGISLGFELGRSGGELLALLDDLPLSQFLPGLPLPAILVQCAAPSRQVVPLSRQGGAFRFEFGQAGGKLFSLSADVVPSLFVLAFVLLGRQRPADVQHFQFDRANAQAVAARQQGIGEGLAVQSGVGRPTSHDGRRRTAEQQAMQRRHAMRPQPQRAMRRGADRAFGRLQSNDLTVAQQAKNAQNQVAAASVQ